MVENLSQDQGLRAYCGLRCDRCEVYRAGLGNDPREQAAVAQAWSARYGWSLSAKDIRCSGCRSTTGAQFKFCRDCAVRQCAIDLGIPGCSHCSQAICTRLAELCTLEPAIQVEHERLTQRNQQTLPPTSSASNEEKS